jgi:hypothetical protein
LSNAKRTTERQEETRLKVINTLAFNPEKFCNLVALKDEKELTRFSVGCFYEPRSKTAFQSRTLTITIPKRDWTHVQFDKTEREAHFQFAALMRGWRAVRRKF